MTERATATALLDAAEAAFAEQGIDAASLRSIMRSAGANPAAVHYHYGSRDELAAAVLARVLEPIQRRRLELLSILEEAAGDRAIALDELVNALIRPDFEAVLDVASRSASATALVGLIYSRPPLFVKSLVEASFSPVAARFLPHFQVALPELGIDEIAWRVRWGVFGLLGAFLSDSETSITAETIDREVAHMVSYLTGALSATPDADALQ